MLLVLEPHALEMSLLEMDALAPAIEVHSCGDDGGAVLTTTGLSVFDMIRDMAAIHGSLWREPLLAILRSQSQCIRFTSCACSVSCSPPSVGVGSSLTCACVV